MCYVLAGANGQEIRRDLEHLLIIPSRPASREATGGEVGLATKGQYVFAVGVQVLPNSGEGSDEGRMEVEGNA